MKKKFLVWGVIGLAVIVGVLVFVNLNIFPFFSYKIGSWSIVQMVTDKYKLYPKIQPGVVLDLTGVTYEKDDKGAVKAIRGTVNAVLTPDQPRGNVMKKDTYVYLGEATYQNDQKKYLDIFLYSQVDCGTNLDSLPFINNRVTVAQLSNEILKKEIKVATNWKSQVFKSGAAVAGELKLPLGSKIILCAGGSPI